jgi:hypothetical protein
MLFENSMFNVHLNSNKSGTSKDDPLMLNEKNNQHDPFKFPTNDPSKDFSFQDCCLVLAFRNNYHPIMGI